MRCVTAWLLALFAIAPLRAGEQKQEAPKIVLQTPLMLTPGATATFKWRGMKLATAREVRIEGANVPVKVVLKEKKTAEALKGFEAKDAGDSIVVAEITAPAALAIGHVRVAIVTADGTATADMRVASVADSIEEKEPNTGFRDAQRIEMGQTIRGGINADQDVDTFQFAGHAGQKVRASVLAARAGSLLDGVLTLYDERGHILSSNDDAEGRDPVLAATLPADGKYFLVLIDAHDRGSEFHRYELALEEAK